MARKKRVAKPLPTIWEVDDELWKIVQEILEQFDPPAPTGRPRTGQREALNGIIETPHASPPISQAACLGVCLA